MKWKRDSTETEIGTRQMIAAFQKPPENKVKHVVTACDTRKGNGFSSDKCILQWIMNFVSYCPTSRPHTLRIIDACSGSVPAASGCSGAEAAWRDGNCILTAPQTAQRQQQLLELIAGSW